MRIISWGLFFGPAEGTAVSYWLFLYMRILQLETKCSKLRRCSWRFSITLDGKIKAVSGYKRITFDERGKEQQTIQQNCKSRCSWAKRNQSLHLWILEVYNEELNSVPVERSIPPDADWRAFHKCDFRICDLVRFFKSDSQLERAQVEGEFGDDFS